MASDNEVEYQREQYFLSLYNMQNIAIIEKWTILSLLYEQAEPRKKYLKLDTNQSIVVRTLNRQFPKIDNLEYFPLKVLLKIFASVGDIDLMSLAENSSRFERIAKMELNQRYEDKYCTIDNTNYGSSQTYKDFIELFGNQIKSIDATDTDSRGDHNWIESILSKANRLEKLRLDLASSISNERLLEQHASSSIIHLTLCNEWFSANGFVLSKFCNLKKFELSVNYFIEHIHQTDPQ